MPNHTLTSVPGVEAGHWTHSSGTTGVTAVLCPQGARGAAVVVGAAPGSRELGALQPSHLAGEVYGICLAGGSAYGLAAADGVMEVLEARGVGFDTPYGPVPIVPAAILFDLHTAQARPDRSAGRHAAEAAGRGPLASGRVGAGAGARVGALHGPSEPGGTGTSSAEIDGWTVGVVAAVNAGGSVYDPSAGRFVAGVTPGDSPGGGLLGTQTTLVVVATDAPLSKAQLQVVARMASAGLARTLVPAFSPFDGDIVFALSTGTGAVDATAVCRVGARAAEQVAVAVLRAVGG